MFELAEKAAPSFHENSGEKRRVLSSCWKRQFSRQNSRCFNIVMRIKRCNYEPNYRVIADIKSNISDYLIQASLVCHRATLSRLNRNWIFHRFRSISAHRPKIIFLRCFPSNTILKRKKCFTNEIPCYWRILWTYSCKYERTTMNRK